jgi:multidrug efflux pump subunit AcrA (membrane-fusion protein)
MITNRGADMAAETPHERRSHRAGWTTLIIVVLIAIGLGVWAFISSRPKPARVEQRDVISYVPLSGTVIAPPSGKRDVIASNPVPVEEVLVSVGQKVYKGDTLVKLYYPSAEDAVRQARDNLRSAEKAYQDALSQQNQLMARQRSNSTRHVKQSSRLGRLYLLQQM